MDAKIRLNPNYRPVKLNDNVSDQFSEKFDRLLTDIGNCILKVSRKPGKALLRRLKKFYIQTNWFKKVRIIRSKLYLFRKKGRFALVLSKADLYDLQCRALDIKRGISADAC